MLSAPAWILLAMGSDDLLRSAGKARPGVIGAVTGRHCRPRAAFGLAAVSSARLLQDDGEILEVSSPGAVGGIEVALDIAAEVPALGFTRTDAAGWRAVCPICFGEPSRKEHVPQGPLGGDVMTMTCQQCNNLLGSRIEADLEDWFDGAVQLAFSHPDVPGRRFERRVLVLDGPGGSMLFPERSVGPEVDQMLDAGGFSVEHRPPDFARVEMALLKHAYLAACLFLRHIPDSADAVQIRADLLTARATPRRSPMTASAYAKRLRVYRSHKAPAGPPLALVRPRLAGTAADAELLISFAGVLFVSWPFDASPADFLADRARRAPTSLRISRPSS